MILEFISSKGVEVFTDLHNNIVVGGLGGQMIEGDREVEALREALVAERDSELQRWRHPDFPDYVGYDWNGSCLVLDERTGAGSMVLPDKADYNEPQARFAKLWYAEHPDQTPWRKAKRGEMWRVQAEGHGVDALVVFTDALAFATERGYFGIDSEQITEGLRIYPPVDPS